MDEKPSTRQVLLGMFIIVQIVFLFTSNFIGFFQDVRSDLKEDERKVLNQIVPEIGEERGHFWHLLDWTQRVDKIWIQSTGQFQSWSLFAPTISSECVFPALELHWDEAPLSANTIAPSLGMLAAHDPLTAAWLAAFADAERKMPGDSELVLSDNEPRDLNHYLRIGNYRFRRHENTFVITLKPYADETEQETKERWSRRLRSHVEEYGDIIMGYLRWKVERLPDRLKQRGTPAQVVILLRRFHINAPDDAPPHWSGPFIEPMARWQPKVQRHPDYRPLEWYDPVTRQFREMRK